MEFLLDENMPQSVLRSLRGAGYNTTRVTELGITDPEVLNSAKAQKRTVVTLDRGFANTLLYPPEDFSGIVLMRRKSGCMTTEDIQIMTNRLLEHLSVTSSLDGQLCIVERAKVRTYVKV